ncbi:hypothetical protein B4064_1760 [Caldibacillus thermoamylovorans]|jgi:hypothetical protein|uniref:Uncharacterized protein n=1 Tax=Caldibacillus thermoamylovorans TaxID=35841 RepID=A0A0D0FA95_9BACI|nr:MULTISPECIES: hypothetical protein [Bacillaceae]KIO62217.1 hypothetical protein B4065_3276 [Caldibacillus thermoamylovorans]KIO68509.1 hypothetical protein B4064_1760 [Caldibacillus thermoamylovorans]KIO68799.1 hypothetical protein B4166_2012 [Caldibacillus thermoamylovorans]KIO73778.1 hypothetical protein B4167_1868 [Caldibacillus thermoamylovorans]MEC5273878.1 hypothetical protein [Caldifermentibacillus hisashii]
MRHITQKDYTSQSYNRRQIEELMGIWKRGYYRKNGAIHQK